MVKIVKRHTGEVLRSYFECDVIENFTEGATVKFEDYQRNIQVMQIKHIIWDLTTSPTTVTLIVE